MSTILQLTSTHKDETAMATETIYSEITGSVWKIQAQPGDVLEADGTLMILESMKMEIPVLAEEAGTITEVKVNVGDVIQAGDLIAVIDN